MGKNILHHLLIMLAISYCLTPVTYVYGQKPLERYETILTKHLTLYQKYPESGKLYGLEGDVIIRIQLDRHGNIIKYNIVHEDSHTLLKAAINEMIKNANPAPQPPETYFINGNERIEFMLPIAFRTKENSGDLLNIDMLFQQKSREAWEE